MQVTIRTHHVDITDSLKDYAEKKLEKLSKFFENIQELTLELDIENNHEEAKRQVAMGTAYVSQAVLRASKATHDMYASIDKVYDKLESQLRKHKEKMKSRKGSQKSSLTAEEQQSEKGIIRNKIEKRYIAKPMTDEEAAEIVDMEKLDFLVFRNSLTEKVNVIYPAGKGSYGLIEP